MNALNWVGWSADEIKRGLTFETCVCERERESNEAWCALVDAALPQFERRLPRDPAEADFLHSIGTPENLIGPARTGGGRSRLARA